MNVSAERFLHTTSVLVVSGVVCCLAVLVSTVRADFFEKDYARAPGVGSAQAHAAQTGIIPAKGQRPAAIGKSASVPNVKLDEVSGEPVLELGLVANRASASALVEQLDATITKLSETVGSGVIKAGPIVIRGGLSEQELGFARLARLRVRGARFLNPADPIASGIIVSPTWFVGTARGYTLLEGISDPASLINARGEFIAPGSVSPTPTPIPDVSADRF